MKKIKLLGSKLVDNVEYPRIPNICIFNKFDSVFNTKFEEGDILDANSIRYFINQVNNINPIDFVQLKYAENTYLKKSDIWEIDKSEPISNSEIDIIYNNVIKH